jgi:nicotinamide mononucleotide transporter
MSVDALEIGAVVLALAYVVLAIRENRWCWVAAFVSAVLYVWIFWQVQLLMESLLQIFYAAMAVYGWVLWRDRQTGQPQSIQTLRWQTHVTIVVSVIGVSAVLGWFLNSATGAAYPYIDSFTTIAALATTMLVAHKVLENWLYWIVIDVISAGLYINRGLDLTAALFMGYVVLALAGYWEWRKHYVTQQTSLPMS